MKKEFITPEVEIIEIDAASVIVTSNACFGINETDEYPA